MSSRNSTGQAKGKVRCLAAMAFGNHLRDWREHNDVSLKEMAADLDISISTVSAWETGRRFPSGVHCDLVAEYLSEPVYQLFYNEKGTGPHTD